MILDGSVVLVFNSDSADELSESVGKVSRRASAHMLYGIRAAMSKKGSIEELPEMYREAREAVKLAFLFDSCRNDSAAPLIDASTPRCCKAVRQVMQYVTEHLGDSTLSLNYIAANILYLNPDYLGKLFKKECGVKFSDYLTSVRIDKAKQILKGSGDLKVYEIAQQIGLGDNSAYFSQVFRKFTGMLPSEYKARYPI